jgi:hypothetical protein
MREYCKRPPLQCSCISQLQGLRPLGFEKAHPAYAFAYHELLKYDLMMTTLHSITSSLSGIDRAIVMLGGRVQVGERFSWVKSCQDSALCHQKRAIVAALYEQRTFEEKIRTLDNLSQTEA